MNTPRSKQPKRFGHDMPKFASLDGTYTSGLWDDQYAMLVSKLATYWPHVEERMINVLHELLGGGLTIPARQIFRSIVSNEAR